MLSASEMDALFGAGNWISMERFMVRQASGKLRCIDNAKKRGQNKAARMFETIFIIGLDFIPAAVKALMITLLFAFDWSGWRYRLP